jgi:hypothetical protein
MKQQKILTKICIDCKEEKSLKEFYKNSKMKDGRLNRCSKCTTLKVQIKNHEKFIALGQICSSCGKVKKKIDYDLCWDCDIERRRLSSKLTARRMRKDNERKINRHGLRGEELAQYNNERNKAYWRRPENINRLKILRQKSHRKAKDGLVDAYVRELLIKEGFLKEMITQDLIDFKRAQITLERQIKKAANAVFH